MTKLVTIVTVTWRRPTVIFKHAIPAVECQDYPEIEHLVVIDGPDPAMIDTLAEYGYGISGRKRVAWLGRNWTGFSGDGCIGGAARITGSYMASGDYIGYLDDDNDLTTDHVSKLVTVLERDNVDIALSPWPDWPDAASGIADANSFLHRAEVLRRGSWSMCGYTCDSELVTRWIRQGATWSYHNEQTVTLNRYNGGKGAPE